MKKFFKLAGLYLLVGTIVLALTFGIGMVKMKFYEFFGTKKANVERKIFKENKSYVEGMISDLAKYKFEWEQEEDEIAIKAIEDMIRDRYANFDTNNIESYQLVQFLVTVRGY